MKQYRLNPCRKWSNKGHNAENAAKQRAHGRSVKHRADDNGDERKGQGQVSDPDPAGKHLQHDHKRHQNAGSDDLLNRFPILHGSTHG